MHRISTARSPLLALPVALLLGACQDPGLSPLGGEVPARPLAAAVPGSPPVLVWETSDGGGAFDFEGVVFGQTKTQELVLTNAGGSASGALTIGWAGAASFRVSRDGCGRASLPPGRSCAVTVEYEPEVLGYEQMALIASGKRREAHARMELRGEGLQSRLQSGLPYGSTLGSDQSSYVKACDWWDETTGDCIVVFPWRSLSALQSEVIPPFTCPTIFRLALNISGTTSANSQYPYLLDRGYAPFGTTLPNGVEIQGLGPVGAVIWTVIREVSGDLTTHAVGTSRSRASATNWTLQPQRYRVILHCVRQKERGYIRLIP